MIPFILTIVGGFLIGDSMKTSQMMEDGGSIDKYKVGTILIYQTKMDKQFGIKGQYWKIISVDNGIAKITKCDAKGNLEDINGEINLEEMNLHYTNWKIKK
jgi:hypothetical protein